MLNDKNYKGSLSLDWINKDLSLYYEIDEKEGMGVRPIWVQSNDIRVAEPRIIKFVKSYGDGASENMLIKGDNLLVLRSLAEMFEGRDDKIKCIYIDPPFNTGNAFKHYEDNLKHSEWLTMMRDRLLILRKLLKKDGFIAVQIDNEELAYLRVIMDQVFGRDNFITQISWERAQRTALGQGASSINDTVEYILIYSNTPGAKLNKMQKLYSIEERTIRQYNKRITSFGKRNLVETFNDKSGNPIKIFKLIGFKIKSISLRNFEERYSEILKEIYDNFDSIVRTSNQQEESTFQQRLISRFKEDTAYLVEYIPSRGKNKDRKTEIVYYGKEVVLFLKNTAKKEKGEILKQDDMNNFWSRKEISMAGIDSEGGVKFRRSKKPEKLMQRIIELCSEKNDWVLDSFAGSGTSGAVAHKLDRRWIMVEMGRHAENLVLPRLHRVIGGKDSSGITKDVKWEGGGGFKYYKLGGSVIYEKDMNWKMSSGEMSEAVFLHFQYKPEKCNFLEDENMYLGKHRATPYHYAVCYASREVSFISEEQYEKIINYLDKEKRFRHLTIFTNTPVAIAPETIDERVLIEKIPAKILREYKLL